MTTGLPVVTSKISNFADVPAQPRRSAAWILPATITLASVIVVILVVAAQ